MILETSGYFVKVLLSNASETEAQRRSDKGSEGWSSPLKLGLPTSNPLIWIYLDLHVHT